MLSYEIMDVDWLWTALYIYILFFIYYLVMEYDYDCAFGEVMLQCFVFDLRSCAFANGRQLGTMAIYEDSLFRIYLSTVWEIHSEATTLPY